MKHEFPRRALIKAAVFAAAVPVTGVLQQAFAAAPLPLVDANDPTAKALGYVVDATKVDLKSNPTYKPVQKCANCAQFQGKVADKQAPCAIFPGKQVAGAGWCRALGLKPGT
jgi:hypothetical protein